MYKCFVSDLPILPNEELYVILLAYTEHNSRDINKWSSVSLPIKCIYNSNNITPTCDISIVNSILESIKMYQLIDNKYIHVNVTTLDEFIKYVESKNLYIDAFDDKVIFSFTVVKKHMWDYLINCYVNDIEYKSYINEQLTLYRNRINGTNNFLLNLLNGLFDLYPRSTINAINKKFFVNNIYETEDIENKKIYNDTILDNVFKYDNYFNLLKDFCYFNSSLLVYRISYSPTFVPVLNIDLEKEYLQKLNGIIQNIIEKENDELEYDETEYDE